MRILLVSLSFILSLVFLFSFNNRNSSQPYFRNKVLFPKCIQLDYKFVEFDILIYKDMIVKQNQIRYENTTSCIYIPNKIILDENGHPSLSMLMQNLYNHTITL